MELISLERPFSNRNEEMIPAQTRPLIEFRTIPMQNSRAVTRSLRIDSDVESRIEMLAEKEGVSFNLLANRSLRRLVEWEATAEKFGFAQVPLHALERVFNILSEEQARLLGREAGKNMMQELILFWFKKLDREAALKLLAMSAKYARLFKMEHTSNGSTETLIIKHDRGRNASAYFAELLKSLFQSLETDVTTQETEGQVVAQIPGPGLTIRGPQTNITPRRLSARRITELTASTD